MPNWCFTHYKIVGDRKDVKKVSDMLTHLQNLPKPFVENGFGPGYKGTKLWLGCIVNYLGGDCKTTYCRGEITDWSTGDFQTTDGTVIKDGLIDIYVESAWSEPEDVRHFLQEKFPEVSIYFIYEEPGMCLYGTNDDSGRFFPERYILEIGDESEDRNDAVATDGPEYFHDISVAAAFVSGRIAAAEPTMESIRSILSDWEEAGEDRWFTFEKFEIVDD